MTITSNVFKSESELIGKQLEDIISLAERLDFLDIQILRKFYMTGKDFPNDIQPYCFPVLFLEMKVNHNLKIGMEALRKRLDNLVRLGLLEKVSRSNPTNYIPVKGAEQAVRAVIARFFVINGLQKFI
jgi:hypothetical protein